MGTFTRRRFLQGLAGAAATAPVGSGFGAPTVRAAGPRNVIFICLDTVRADHLGCYGYRRGTSPNLDQLTERSVVFDDVLSPSSWTLPVLASALTGLYPHEHGALYFRTPIRPGTIYLPELLSQAGMTTAAMGQYPFSFPFYRFQNGFDVFEQKWSQLAPATTRQAQRWLGEQADGKTGFFLWVHYFEPHVPYEVQLDSIGFYDHAYRGSTFKVFDAARYLKLATEQTLSSASERKRIVDLYDGEIFCADKYLGWILRELRRLKLQDRTMVVVMADHGEHFGEHGLVEHGNSLYEELVRVPMVIHVPGCKPGRCRQLVSPIDIVPTILDFLDMPARQIPGHSLMPALDAKPLPERVLFSTLDTATSVIFVPDGRDPSKAEARDTVIHNVKAVRQGPKKLIYSAKDRAYELYDLRADPHERRNLLAGGSPPPADLKRHLDDWLLAMERHKPTVAVPNRAVLDAMRSLGYIQ